MYSAIPGTYSVFKRDGSLMTWGIESVRVEITLDNRVHIYSGDWETPRAISTLARTTFISREQFEICLALMVQEAIIRRVKELAFRLHAAHMLLKMSEETKAHLGQGFMAGRITKDEWKSQLRELWESEEFAQEIIPVLYAEIARTAPGSEIEFVGL